MGRADGRLYLGMSPLQDGEGAQRRLYGACQDLAWWLQSVLLFSD